MGASPSDEHDLTLPSAAMGEAGPVVQRLNQLLHDAVRRRASDVHLDPEEDGSVRVRLRVDGVLHDADRLPGELAPGVVSRIKILSALDLGEKRLPQDGRIRLKLGDRDLDLRVSLVPTVFGERVVMRILERAQIAFDLHRLGLVGEALATVRELAALPAGLVVVNGPTGSGKTTVLYSMLHAIDRKRRSVLSVEDPIEYHLDDVSQIQVDARRGLTFTRALRHLMRQDPDVIMIGEVRDLSTLQGAVTAATTGHLVLTTLHANTSPGAVKRMLDMGLEPYLLNGALAGVVSLRLARKLCPECRQPVDPDLTAVPPEGIEAIEALHEATFYGPQGCERCGGTGYRGRTGVFEVLRPDDRLRRTLLGPADLETLRTAALAAGMEPMLAYGIRAAARGITSVQEVCHVVPRGPNV
ncbi:MAG: GspE/PulE family protein [Planctomycetota bacterium]